MTFTEAMKILELHNKWRRDNHVPNKYEMVNPTELGVAIDTAVEALNSCISLGCKSYCDILNLCRNLGHE